VFSDNAYLSVESLKIAVKLISHELIHDFTLRTLSVLVVTSLIVCLAFLAFRWFWLRPAERIEVALTPAVVPPPALQRVPVAMPAPARPAEVLMNPGYAYRCNQGGKVVYSERPCSVSAESAVRIVK
jgi:hypothetical protein